MAPHFEIGTFLGLHDGNLLKPLGKHIHRQKFIQVNKLIYIMADRLYLAWREILHLTSSDGI